MTDLQIRASVYRSTRSRDRFPRKVYAVLAIGIVVFLVGVAVVMRIG